MASLYRVFLKGLLTLLPIFVTLSLFAWIAAKAESMIGDPLMRSFFPEQTYVPGAGIVLTIVLIFVVGLLVNNYLTQKFVDVFEKQLERMPLIRSVYSPIRDVTQLFAQPPGQADGEVAQRVVMVQIESMGGEVMGLVTRDQFHDLPEQMIPADSVAVFVPFSYGMGGWTVIVPKARVRETGLAADKAMQLAITGWIKASKST